MPAVNKAHCFDTLLCADFIIEYQKLDQKGRENVKEIKRERKYIWYVQPLDKSTNDILSGMAGEENFLENQKVEGTEERVPLWRLPTGRSKLMALRASRAKLGLKFRLFIQEGAGKIRPFPFR